jgi:hypothetical protein
LKAPKGNIVDESKPVTIGVAAVSQGRLGESGEADLRHQARIWYSIFHQYGWSSGVRVLLLRRVGGGETLDVVGKGQVVFTPKKPGNTPSTSGRRKALGPP